MGDSRSEWRLLSCVVAALMAVIAGIGVTFWPAMVAGYTNVTASDQFAARERIALKTHGVGPELAARHYVLQTTLNGDALWSNCAHPQDRRECIREVTEADGRFILTSYDRNWRGSVRNTQYAAVGFAVYTPLGDSAMIDIQVCPAPPDATFEILFSVQRPTPWGDCGQQP